MFNLESTLSLEFFIRFFINLISLLVLLRFIHYPATMQRDSLSGYLLFANGIFIVTALLRSVEMSMGFAFGLFAVFAMLRYRTETLSTVGMSFLFASVSISLMSAVSNLNVLELMVINGMICALAAFCQSAFLARKSERKRIVYEKIELIHPERMDELLADLKLRTGLPINRAEVGNIDFLQDTAEIQIFYPLLDEPETRNLPIASKEPHY